MVVKDIKVFLKKKAEGQYGCERDKYVSTDEKQKLVEYRKTLIKW